jgi:hypothetical protein
VLDRTHTMACPTHDISSPCKHHVCMADCVISALCDHRLWRDPSSHVCGAFDSLVVVDGGENWHFALTFRLTRHIALQPTDDPVVEPSGVKDPTGSVYPQHSLVKPFFAGESAALGGVLSKTQRSTKIRYFFTCALTPTHLHHLGTGWLQPTESPFRTGTGSATPS